VQQGDAMRFNRASAASSFSVHRPSCTKLLTAASPHAPNVPRRNRPRSPSCKRVHTQHFIVSPSESGHARARAPRESPPLSSLVVVIAEHRDDGDGEDVCSSRASIWPSSTRPWSVRSPQNSSRSAGLRDLCAHTNAAPAHLYQWVMRALSAPTCFWSAARYAMVLHGHASRDQGP
jgi:hypothetical protein